MLKTNKDQVETAKGTFLNEDDKFFLFEEWRGPVTDWVLPEGPGFGVL